jgi:hypothetical protein
MIFFTYLSDFSKFFQECCQIWSKIDILKECFHLFFSDFQFNLCLHLLGQTYCFHPVRPSITKVCEHNSFYILIGNSTKLCMVAYCRIEIHILLLLISLRFYFWRNCLLCISSQILSQALIKVFWKFKIWPHSAFWCIFCHGWILSDQVQVRFHI